jgi:hypothetical protein
MEKKILMIFYAIFKNIKSYKNAKDKKWRRTEMKQIFSLKKPEKDKKRDKNLNIKIFFKTRYPKSVTTAQMKKSRRMRKKKIKRQK